MSKKTRKKELRRFMRKQPAVEEEKIVQQKAENGYEGKNKFLKFYFDNYKKLLIIPIVMLLVAMLLIGIKIASTGEFVNKGISLKGGTVVTVTSENLLTENVRNVLSSKTGLDLSVRELTEGSKQIGLIIETDITSLDEINPFISLLRSEFNLKTADYSIETMGSSLGESFFRQTFGALILAFIFMAVVVFFYFKTFVPSLAVVLAAFSDMVITLAIVNMLGIDLTTAGIAAFLMLIGYSVDTDILLTTKVLKEDSGSVHKSILKAMKTGLTMTITTLIAVIVALFVAESEVIKQIMTILLIGLAVDIVNTWIQNAGIIRWYMEKKHEKA